MNHLAKIKQNGGRIAALTAYDFLTAQLLDRAGIDMILVGDSLANVVFGYTTTVPVTMDEMLHHSKAVARGVARALTVADMPFLSFQTGLDDAVRNAGRFLKEGGVEAVKIEGAGPVLAVVERLVEVGIPVMGHLGYTPQSVHRFGSNIVQAKTAARAGELLNDAIALEGAGAFAVVSGVRAGRSGAINYGAVDHTDHRHRRRTILRRPDSGAARRVGADAV